MSDELNTQVLPEGEAAGARQTVPDEPLVAATPPAQNAVPATGGGVQAQQSTSGLAIAGLVLGILAILGSFIPLLNILTAPFAIIGLALAIIGFLGINKGKHTGRGVAIAGIVLGSVALVVTIGMYGCAGAIAGSSNASSSAASSASTSGEQAPSASSAAKSPARVLGTWHMVSGEVGAETFGPEEIATLESSGDRYIVKFADDGQFGVFFGNAKRAFKGTWEDGGSGTIALSTADASGTMVIDGDSAELKMEVTDGSRIALTLERVATAEANASGSAVAEANASSSAASEAEQSSQSDEVSPDLKEALDSYEAFVDEYVEFMQKYKESGNATSMLSDYSQFMQKYAELAGKIENMDTSNMSNADYAYYIEVTSRVSQKLVNAL